MTPHVPKRRIFWGILAIVLLGIINFTLWTWPWLYTVILFKFSDEKLVVDSVATRIPLEIVQGDFRPLPRAKKLDPRLDFSGVIALGTAFESYSLLIWHNDKVVLEQYGSGGTLESMADSASMHKGILALLIGTAIADGTLPNVDVPIGGYINSWANDSRGQITLRQTLQMASGLKPFSKTGGLLSENMRFVMGLWQNSLILNRPLEFRPGTQFTYLNLNSQIAGMVLQNATSRRYAEYLSEKLWKPLGAKDAYVWLYTPDSLARTYSGFFASAEDWLRVGIVLKDRGLFEGRQIVPAAWIDQMIAPSPQNPNYGLQVWLARPYILERRYDPASGVIKTGKPWLDDEIFFLDGFGGQRVYISRKYDFVMVRMGAPTPLWEDTALPNAVIKALLAAGTSEPGPAKQ